MNAENLEKARQKIGSVPVLVNMISKRVKQLNGGAKPLTKPVKGEDHEDVAIREIAEGLLVSEVDFDAVARHEKAQNRYSDEGF